MKEITEKIIELAERNVMQNIETFAKQVSEILFSDRDSYRAGNSMILEIVAKTFADRYVKENYEQLAGMIDLERLARMAELAAIGKTFK